MSFVRFADDAKPLPVTVVSGAGTDPDGWKTEPVSIALGAYANASLLRKFGANADIDTATVPEDVWNAGGLWVPPTQARTHTIASTDAADTMQLTIWGLTSWSGSEVSETITLNGVTGVGTVNSYVIIHRMRVESGYANAGVIDATADTDATVTARINAGEGTTHMLIYGLGAEQTLLITSAVVGVNRSQASGYAEFEFDVNFDPTVDVDAFRLMDRRTATAQGTSVVDMHFDDAPLVIPGPAILKVRVSAVGGNDTRVFGNINGYLYTTA